MNTGWDTWTHGSNGHQDEVDIRSCYEWERKRGPDFTLRVRMEHGVGEADPLPPKRRQSKDVIVTNMSSGLWLIRSFQS